MVLPRVRLNKHPAHTRLAVSHHDEEVFADEAIVAVLVDDLNVGESLLVGTYLVLTLDDEHALPA